jgi:hypothetical protein
MQTHTPDHAGPVGPRDYTPGAGMPGDRRACVAALQAFRDLKRTYLHVLDESPGADWLRKQVVQADEPVDLWLLRAPAFALLDGVDAEHRSRRQLLRRGLDTMFPDLETAGNPAND